MNHIRYLYPIHWGTTAEIRVPYTDDKAPALFCLLTQAPPNNLQKLNSNT